MGLEGPAGPRSGWETEKVSREREHGRQVPKTKGHGLPELLKRRQVQKQVVGGGGGGVEVWTVSELDDRHLGSRWGQGTAPVLPKLTSGNRRAGMCPTEVRTLRSALECEAPAERQQPRSSVLGNRAEEPGASQ